MDAATAMRELCAGWERMDAKAIGALFAPDGVYEGPLFGEFPVGPEAVEAACAAAFAELTEVQVPVTTLAASGQVALAEGRFQCTDHAGARTDFPLVMAVELRDGRVVRFTEYFDTVKVV